jgi:hypothetical protein
MRSSLKCGYLHTRDWFSNNRSIRLLAAAAQWLLACIHQDPSTRRSQRLRAIARMETRFLMQRLGSRPLETVDNNIRPSLSRHETILRESPALTRSVVLKPPLDNGERGVLLVMFEYNWFRILAQVTDWAELEQRYDVIWATSWSPTDFVLLDWILRRSKGPVVVLPSHPDDQSRFELFDSRIRCPDIQPGGDFIDPNCFKPRPWSEREIDILMVANWAPFKRHYELFLALRAMPKSLRVVLIGQPEAGFKLEDIQNLATTLRVPQSLDIRERLPLGAVHEAQCNSKTALILSRREGSCVAAVEALFAGASLGMRADAHVGALSYVNEHTGMRFRPGKLAKELPVLLEKSSSLKPHIWAERHLASYQAVTRLNAFMKNLSFERYLPWTRDLAAVRWNPYPELIDSNDEVVNAHEWEALSQLFPGPFVVAEHY